MLNMPRILAVLAGLCLLAAPALGQARESAYIVSNVEVDARADTAANAQRAAWAEARIKASQTMIERLTLPEDRAAGGLPPITSELAGRLAAAIDVQEERRSANRYVGVLRVVFDPGRVRALLRDAKVPYTDLVAPLALMEAGADGVTAADAALWREALGKVGGEGLAPFEVASLRFDAGAGWAAAAGAASDVGARRLARARLSGVSGDYRVSVADGPVGGDLGGATSLGPFTTIPQAARATADALQADWKRASIIRGGVRDVLTATARYTSLSDWIALRSALIQAARVSDLRVDAISTDGALVTFAYAGNRSELGADLRRQGVLISDEAEGPVLRLAGLR